ncbi:MucBP domain-containing protein [Lactococcus petauri]|nr:MucBP domain-containing protein [Lactococcus petauri]
MLNIVFAPVINNLSNRTLFFNFWSGFNKNTLNYDAGNDLAFPTKNNLNNSIHVNFSKSSSGEGSGNSAIAKTLHYEANDIVTWTITINNGGYEISDANFADTMSNTQDYIPGSTSIHYRNYKNTVIKTESTDLVFNPNADGSQSTSLNLGHLHGDTEASLTEPNSVVIHYQTKLKSNPLNNKYPNQAFSYDGTTLIDSAVSTATYHGQGGGGTGDLAGDVLIKYVDELGNKLIDNITLKGNIGQPYTSEQKEIEGYTFKEVQGNPTGIFTDQAQTITYVYTKIPAAVNGDVTVQYVDETGKKLSTDEKLTGKVGDPYISEQKEIEGYTFKEVQGNPTGTFTDQAQTITYVYTKLPVKGETVTVKYTGDDGKKIAEDTVLTGNIGEEYVSTPKELPGYSIKGVQGNPKGVFTSTKQEVKYLYAKNQTYQANLPATGEDNGKFLTIIGVILLFLIGGVIVFVRKINKYK